MTFAELQNKLVEAMKEKNRVKKIYGESAISDKENIFMDVVGAAADLRLGLYAKHQ